MIRNLFAKLTLVWALLLVVSTVWSDVGNEVMCHLTKEDNLAGETVNDIMTDHNGQVWIATSNGVNRFSGKNMVTYGFPKPEVYTKVICEALGNKIFAATGSGLYELTYKDKAFRRILPKLERIEVIVSSGRQLLIGNADGLRSYDGHQLKDLVVSGNARMSVDNSVRDILPERDGQIWYIIKYAICCYDTKTGKVRSWRLADKMSEGAAFAKLAYSQGQYFIGTKNNGLWSWNPQTNQVVEINGVGNIITSLEVIPGSRLAVGTDGVGAFVLSGQTHAILERYSTEGDPYHRIPSDAVYCYFKDASDVNWFGMFRHGLSYSYHSTPIFRPYSYKTFTTDGMSVRSFFVRDKEYVIGTSKGFWYIDENRDITKYISPSEMFGANLVNNIMWYEGNYYIASYDGGLIRFNPKTLSVSRLGLNPLLDYTTISSLAVSPNNRLWIGTGEGLFIFDRQGKLMHYTEHNASLNGGSVSDIFFDGHQQAWLNGPNGLTLYNSSNQQFANSGFPTDFFHKERDLKGSFGHDSMLYFASRRGVFFTDYQMRRYGKLDAMPEQVVGRVYYSFIDDQKGYYWVAAENGLFRTDYKNTSLLHLGYGEGLRSRIISSGGLLRYDNQLWVATDKGLLILNEAELNNYLKSTDYKVTLYDMRIGADKVANTAESMINEEHLMKVGWNFTSAPISVKPILEDFAYPYGRIYEYKMEGDTQWHYSVDGKEIKLKNLSIGSHDFTVRLSGVPGTARTYTIYVYPSWLAIVEFLLLVIALFLFIWWRRYRRDTNALLVERDEIEKALLESEEQNFIQQEKQEDSTKEAPQKYSRVHIDEKECEQIVERMKKYIETDQVYKNPDLKMKDLADYLHLSSSKLSQVFNLYLKENYYDFINRYRLEEFKRLVAAGGSEKYTIIALSEQCGFKKSSFFSTFRKVEGMTPTEYLKKNSKPIKSG